MNLTKFAVRYGILLSLVLITNKYSVFCTEIAAIKEPIDIVNAFSGCNIRLINFKGLDLNFYVLKEPILLLRYLSHCKVDNFFSFEFGSNHPALQSQNSSACRNDMTSKANFSLDQQGMKYVAQTLTESFQLKCKNKLCEANIYLDPPTEHDSPQMYARTLYWQSNLNGNFVVNLDKTTETGELKSVLQTPNLINLEENTETQRWKVDYLNTIPRISVLICTLNEDSICKNDNDINKWIAGVFYDYKMTRLSVTLLVWEYSSQFLKTLCPYCDPCYSFKLIPLPTKLIPTSNKELNIILGESQQLNRDPDSVRVILLYGRIVKEDLRNIKNVLKYIQKYSVVYRPYFAADEQLTSILLPKSANITFSDGDGTILKKWGPGNDDVCSPNKNTSAHSAFRPMLVWTQSKSPSFFQDARLVTSVFQLRFVSCHKEQVGWTNQLKELVSPFDMATWLLVFAICVVVSLIVKPSTNWHNFSGNLPLLNVTFYMFCSILDQPNRVLETKGKTFKCSFYFCIFWVPITWLYLSTLYKGENVTKLTAKPRLVPFDTFEKLQEYKFNTYSVRFNLNTFYNMVFINMSELQKEHVSISSHEALPVVSQLWYELMIWLRPIRTAQLGSNFLKEEIPRQMWTYINNSAMLPDYGQGFKQHISVVLNFHMKKCNKSAIILFSSEAIKLHTVLKQMGKSSYLGNDKILETFWGYKFLGYFPPKFLFRSRYVFDAGIFEWWRSYIDYSFVTKLNIHQKGLMASYNQTGTSEMSANKTAAIVLSLIPGFGLLLSLTVFICAEKQMVKVFAIFSKCATASINLGRHIAKLLFKLDVKEENVISIINVQPLIDSSN